MKRFCRLVAVVVPFFWSLSAAGEWCGTPTSIADAILALDTCLERDQKDEIHEKKRTEMVEYHFGFGLSLRNEWGLWHGSKLAKQFEDNGIFRPDDMSSLILDLYWKRLNDLPLDLQESVTKLKDDYLELAATIDSSGVVVGDPENVVPLPDPAKVNDRVIELPFVPAALFAYIPAVASPVSFSGLRRLAADNPEFSRCTSGKSLELCWVCKDHVCGHTERAAYSGWSVSGSAFATLDGQTLLCVISGQAIRIAINYSHYPLLITFQVPRDRHLILREERPMHLLVDGERFTNRADASYLNAEFQNDDGSIAEKRELLGKMKSAYQIAVEGWNIDDEKVSTVDLGEGLGKAVQRCHSFAAAATVESK